jgi:hypothetical protein
MSKNIVDQRLTVEKYYYGAMFYDPQLGEVACDKSSLILVIKIIYIDCLSISLSAPGKDIIISHF